MASDLLVRLKLDDKGLDAQLKGVSSKFKTAAAGIARIAVPVAAIAGIAKVVDGLAEMGERAIKAAGSLQDTSAQLGVTAEKLQELRLIASNAGVDVDSFDKSLSVLNRTLGKAALGQGDFEKVAKAAGISLRDQQGHILDTGDTWDALTAKIQSGALSQNQAIALAAAAFGREGGKMVEVLRQTAAEQQKVIDTARSFGAIISNEVVRSADEYGDQLELVKKGTEALGIQNDLILAPLTLAWAELKNSIALAVGELAGVDAAQEAMIGKRIANIEGQIMSARARIAVPESERNKGLMALLTGTALTDTDLVAQGEIDAMSESLARLKAELKSIQDAKPDLKPAASSGSVVETDEEAKAREHAAKAAADYELQLITDVAAERDRVAQEEIALEAQYLQELSDERERAYGEELKQIEDWNETLSKEREHAATMELDQYIQKEGLLTEAKRAGDEAREKLNTMTAGKQASTMLDSLVTMTAGVAQHSKKMFELNKKLSLAQAAVALPAAVLESFRNGGGWPWGAVAASVMAATGAAQISAIRKTTFEGGGGGTTPSAAGTTPVVNGNPVPQQSQSHPGTLIRIEGSGASFSTAQVRQLIDQINEAIGDGAHIVFANP